MTKRCIVSLILCSLGLSLGGCSFNPFTADNNFTGSPGPAVAGGAIGAGAAALLGAPKAVIGLAGLGGATVGYYVSTLNYAAGGIVKAGGQVYTLGEYVTIEIPTDFIFDENSAELLPEAGPALTSTVSVLEHFPNHNIMVSGNTSGYGVTRRELRLSEARAREVAAFLWSHGISEFKATDLNLPTRKLIYVGYGNYFPIANNIRAASIRSNSRIQITAFPTTCKRPISRYEKVFGNIGAWKD